MTEADPKPYDRLTGEPNLWYDRFHTFMRLGPGRSLNRCYRQVINAERAVQGRPPLPVTASCSDVWRQRARQFDWFDRAEAWDHECRRQDLQQVEQTPSKARTLAPEALRVLEAAMRGELKNPDGSLTPGQNCTQRRLAAERILNVAGIIDLAADQEDPQPPVKGLMFHDAFTDTLPVPPAKGYN